MEKLADNLQRLSEDDLLLVVSMVHENKTADTYTKNDVERKLLRHELLLSGLRTDELNRRRIPCGPLHVTR